MPETEANSPTAEPGHAPKRKRRWWRRVLILLLVIPLLLAAIVLIVGQTNAMKSFVEPALESQLGVDVQTRSIKLGPDGTIVIRDAVFSTQAIDGKAGELIEIDRAVINVDWGGIARGRGLQISSIEIDRPTLRVSQSSETGKVNLAQLRFESDGGGGTTPSIELSNGTLEIGEHTGGDFTLLKSLSMRGRIEPADDQGISRFSFVALPVEAGMRGELAPGDGGVINLNGQISNDGVDARLDGLRLEDWPGDFVPSRSREMYERLALSGELAPTTLTVDEQGEVEVVLTLDGVSLNLPFNEDGSMTGSGELLRMRQTRGWVVFGTRGIRADLKGFIDELEYGVVLDYKGLDSQSDFEVVLTTEFRLDAQFKPAEFLPENVISKLDRFEDPTADVAARVEVTRSDGEAVRVSGRATLSNGSAIYKKFRYRFNQLEGVISFDPDKLVVERITGVGPTGARLLAEGLFSPLGEESVVTLSLSVDGVPVDRYLLEALDDNQRELISALFNQEDYENLLEEGLLISTEQREQLRADQRELQRQLEQWVDAIDGDQRARDTLASEIAAIERSLGVPEFSFGGSANVDVVLRRHPERPEDNRWTTDVVVDLPEAGLVPGHFPLPIIAHGIEITITEERVELTGGEYTGIDGGTATVEALIDRTKPDSKPVVRIDARDIPIDDRLVAAIPGYYAEQSDDPDDISLRRILDRMRLSGRVDCSARIGPRSDNRLGFDVESTITDGTARPIYQGFNNPDDPLAVELGADPLALNDLYGTVYVTEELIIVDLSAMLSAPELPLAPTPVTVLTQLTLPEKTRGEGGMRREGGLLPIEFGPPVPGPELYALARVDGLDFAMPLQHAVAVVSPRIARDMLRYESEFRPDGIIAIDARLEGFVGGGLESTFGTDRIESLAFDYGGVHYTLGASWGSAELSLSHHSTLSFDAFRVPISAQGRDAGELSVDGRIPLTRPGQLIEIDTSDPVRLSYLDGTLESPLSRLVLDRFGSESARSWVRDNRLRGAFDLDVTLFPQTGTYRIAPDAPTIGMLPMAVHGQLTPKSLSLTMSDREARFDSIEGVVLFEGYEGRFDHINAVGDESTISVDGPWTYYPGEGLGMRLDVGASGSLLDGPARALLPMPVARIIDQLEIKAEGGITIDDMRIETDAFGTPRGVYDIRGSAKIQRGSALIGLPITGLSGSLGFAVRGSEEALGYELRLDASRLRAGLLRVYDAQVEIIGDANNPGVVLIPEIVAGMHGGRIAGSAQILPHEDDATAQYWMEMHASGVRAAPVFDDLLLPPEGLVGPPLPGQTAVLSGWSKADDLSRGSMLADLTLTGPIGNPDKRAGRGTVEIKGGSVLALPGFINLIEASNLSFPTGATIDLAEADFYIDGPTLAFEQLSASSRRIEILGYGTLGWDTRALDLRFSSRAINPIPLVSSLLESLRDELITISVTGTTADPVYSASQFGETRQLVNALLGKPLSEQQQRMREVEAQVERDRRRVRRSTSDEVHRPTRDAPDDKQWDPRAPAPTGR